MTKRRKKVSIHNRLTPCFCCGYPISQRHHLLHFAEWGDLFGTIQLCANCHELYHLIFEVFQEAGKGNTRTGRSAVLINQLTRLWGTDDKRIQYLANIAEAALDAQEKLRKDRDRLTWQLIGAFFGGEDDETED